MIYGFLSFYFCQIPQLKNEYLFQKVLININYMIKIRYRGTDILDPEMSPIKAEVNLIKKKFKKVKCLHHTTPTIIHLRYVKQYPVLERYVKACCYEFENYVKSRLQQEVNA